MENEDNSGLYELSGLRKIFENVDEEREMEKKEKEKEFWKDIESEKDIFEDDFKDQVKEAENDEIDPFWLT